jgi:hypothetical protein
MDHLRYPESDSNYPPLEYSEFNTLLLDDSPLKAVHQPWNQLVIPEYDRREYDSSNRAASLPHTTSPVDAEDDGMDIILLSVVGILEELRNVVNVPAWIRGGGLTLSSASISGEPTLFDLPSHESFAHWYATRRTRHHWAAKGVSALARKGITPRHGINPPSISRGNTPIRPSPSRGSTPLRVSVTPPPRQASSVRYFSIPSYIRTDGDSTPETTPKRRGWSPSRPAEEDEEEDYGSVSGEVEEGDVSLREEEEMNGKRKAWSPSRPVDELDDGVSGISLEEGRGGKIDMTGEEED